MTTTSSGQARVPEEPASLPRQLGRFPFWQGGEEFLPALEAIYARASQVGLELYSMRNDPRYRPAEAWMITHLDRGNSL